MSGLRNNDQDTLKYRDQENIHAGNPSDMLQFDWKVGLAHIYADMLTLPVLQLHGNVAHARAALKKYFSS